MSRLSLEEFNEVAARLRGAEQGGYPASFADVNALLNHMDDVILKTHCVYCGHESPNDPDIIKAHILSCDNRPEKQMLAMMVTLKNDTIEKIASCVEGYAVDMIEELRQLAPDEESQDQANAFVEFVQMIANGIRSQKEQPSQ